MLPYIKFNIEQNTPEWHEWRAKGLGASSAATILGENPWRTRAEFLEELLHPKPFEINEAMELGHDLEPIARKYYQRKRGLEVNPICLQSVNWPWLLASLDGMTEDGSNAVEIKSGVAAYEETAKEMKVPSYYRAQVQQQLAVTGLKQMDFWAFWPGRSSIGLTVKRNDAYIERIVNETKQFWDELQEARK